MPDRLPVPLIPRHPPDDIMLQIERLRDVAADASLGTLAYHLEVARLEAQRISDQAGRATSRIFGQTRAIFGGP